MVFVCDKYYFNGEQVHKHVIGKYLKWERILSAINNGANSAELLIERLGKGTADHLRHLKADGMCVANGSNRYATYTVTPKGQELIEKVKQYKKENKK